MLLYDFLQALTEVKTESSLAALLQIVTHAKTRPPLNCVFVIVFRLGPDPAPQPAGGQSGPHAVRGQAHSAAVTAAAAAPAMRGQLIGAAVGQTGAGGGQQAVEEVADGHREISRFHVLPEES